jgi:hypothetical protein
LAPLHDPRQGVAGPRWVSVVGREHPLVRQEKPVPTHDQIIEALRDRLLEAITSRNMTSDTILTLAEAYAWLTAPDQPHGQRRDSA